MEFAGEPPPLWPQLTTSITRRHRRSPSPLFTPPVLIILLPTILLLILFFAVPPFLSTVAAQISRPTGVKKSSDSLTILLVFFAILSWVFARRNDGDNVSSMDYHDSSNNNKLRPASPVSQRWFDQYAERKFYDDNPPMNAAASATEQPNTSLRRLKRSSTSYPDLRQDSLWENSEDRNRFYDDFEISKYRSSTNNYIDQVHELRRSWRSEQFEESEFNVIPPSKSPAPSTPPPPPPPPPPAAAYQKPRRTYQAIGQKEKVTSHVEFDRSESPQPVTPPPPPPPPPRRPPSPLVRTGNRSEQRFAKLERRKSNAAKEIKMVFASLRKRKKKKKGSTKDHDDHQHDCPLHSQSEPPPYYSTTIPPPSPPPPPPPPMPPPPSSVFQKYNLFRSKGNKSKKIHSVPPAPPPPPPPPPPQHSVSKFMQNIQTPPTTPPPAPPTPPPGPSRRRTTPKSSRPPLPTKANTSIYYDENVNSGGQSPLIPNPPPPPPFKMPEFKSVFRGDFVNIRSSPSSRCSSPDLEEVNAPSSKYDDNDEKVSMMEGDDGGGVGGRVPVINCPSPDVNAKAETFIARFRDGWKLEKINSMKQKQRT